MLKCMPANGWGVVDTVAIDWEPGSVTWYVDGAPICTVDAAISAYDSTNGGAQLDLPDAGSVQPARQDVDWIHVYPVAATQYDPQS
jgi:beta-glucanase (GH16 family)